MEQFNLDIWLQDKSRKVVTRDRRHVRIICWDRNTPYWKIVGLVISPDGSVENPFTYDVNGNESDGCLHDNRNDLFFADEEDELTEFEKDLQIIISEASHWTSDDGNISTYCQFGDKQIKKISGQILDLARKELLKDLPKWKKCVGSTGPFIDNFRGEDYLYLKDYVIKVSELFETLPKEE